MPEKVAETPSPTTAEGERLVVASHSEGGVLEVRLTRPDKRNALSSTLLDELEASIDVRPDTRVVVLSAEGPVFSAGVDVTALTGDAGDMVIDRRVRTVARKLDELRVPTIAAVDQPCFGAANELLLACDGWVVRDGATINLPSLRMGLLYDPTTLARLQHRLGDAAVRRLVLLQRPLTGQDLGGAALRPESGKDGSARSLALEVAAELAQMSPDLVAMTKATLRGLASGQPPDSWADAHLASFVTEERRSAVDRAQRRGLPPQRDSGSRGDVDDAVRPPRFAANGSRIPHGPVDLGLRSVSYDVRDTLLYAVAVGAGPEQLDLVYEREAEHALPTMAAALGLWVTEAAATELGYDRDVVLHIGQKVEVHSPLPVADDLRIRGTITRVLDKGRAGIVHLTASCQRFTATYVMFVPGLGGFGGDRGDRVELPEFETAGTEWLPLASNAAVLYRLTGDDHPVHVDPAVARRAGHDRPIMHGLCTLGMSVLSMLRQAGAAARDVRQISTVWTSPALPGEELAVSWGSTSQGIRFAAYQGRTMVCEGLVELASVSRVRAGTDE